MAFSTYTSSGYYNEPYYGVGGNMFKGLVGDDSSLRIEVPQSTPTPQPTTQYESPAGPSYTPPSNNTGGSTSGSNSGSSSNNTSKETYDQEQAMIDDMYDSNNDYLNSLYRNVRGGEQDFYNTYTQPYDAQVPLITQARDQGLQSISNQQTLAGQQEQSALAAARQLYNELMMRNQQAFGGAALSSVGQAAGEILGRSANQQFGGIRQNAQNTIQGLATEARNVQAQADAQLQQLNMQKEAALSDARLAFRDKLAEIDRMKSELKSNRSAMKLDALREFRSNIQAIANQATAFQQSLEAMKYQAQLNLQNTLASVNAYSQAGIQSGQNMLGQQEYGNASGQNQFGQGNAVGSTGDGYSFGDLPFISAFTGNRKKEEPTVPGLPRK